MVLEEKEPGADLLWSLRHRSFTGSLLSKTWREFALFYEKSGLEARKKIIYEFQRYEAEQQHYVYANSITITASWQPYVKNYAPNQTFDYGSRVAALWLDR